MGRLPGGGRRCDADLSEDVTQHLFVTALGVFAAIDGRAVMVHPVLFCRVFMLAGLAQRGTRVRHRHGDEQTERREGSHAGT